MSDVETLAERVRTVERAVTDGDHDLGAVDDLAALTERVESLEREVAELNDRTDELSAATQALRGYVGNVRSVNERVEGRADTALAATERLERRFDAMEGAGQSGDPALADSGLDGRGTDGRATGATRRERSAVDTHDSGGAEGETTDGGAAASRDPGVLEQIRSLL